MRVYIAFPSQIFHFGRLVSVETKCEFALFSVFVGICANRMIFLLVTIDLAAVVTFARAGFQKIGKISVEEVYIRIARLVLDVLVLLFRDLSPIENELVLHGIENKQAALGIDIFLIPLPEEISWVATLLMLVTLC